GAAWTDLADVLCDQGEYSKAKEAYQAGLEIIKELGDTRSVAVITGQLGTLAKEQGKLAEAAKRHKEAQVLFQRINEPAMEAVAWHQLGMVYQQAKQWEAAEQAYRQSAQLKVEQGLLAGYNGAASTWDQLGQICDYTGRQEEAEQWFRKALDVRRAADDRPGMARTLNNLAVLLANDPTRLDEARGLAEESLAIKDTLDPAVVEIWETYTILARIAEQQGDDSRAAAYRSKAERAFAPYAGGDGHGSIVAKAGRWLRRVFGGA
ncbi:MAG: tetratricopeptide repeat protein, partial [Candidatus Electrothrix sp. AUS3]|nr:tetratricopeptide repeat protein [Candidatus Electrothrix gigas]